MERKINYHKEALKIVAELQGRRPKLLAHVCCGPCSTYPLKWLHQYFDMTLIYHNSNIYPKAEYDRRYRVLLDFVTRFNADYGATVEVIATPYENDRFNQFLEPFKDEPEGGARCRVCYRIRMEESMAYAASHGYEYFTTVMTISPHKDSQVINSIGRGLQIKYLSVRYFHSDFKKDNGFLEAGNMCEKYCLYRQVYCGCRYSYEAMMKGDERPDV